MHPNCHIYQVKTWNKNWSKHGFGAPTKFYTAIFNVANFGEHFRFQIENNMKIVWKLGRDGYIEMKFLAAA